MALEDQLIKEIFKLVQEMNRSADERGQLPFAEVFFSIQVRFPFGDKYGEESKVEGFHISLDIVKGSGHGPESHHLLRDSVSMVLVNNQVLHVLFERDGLRQAVIDDFNLTQESFQDLIERMRVFCEQVLPPELFFMK